MPTYQYRCESCKRAHTQIRRIEARNAPSSCAHCGAKAEREITATMVATSFRPYKAIAGDRRTINSEHEHRDFLKRFNLEEVGNDKSMYPTETQTQEAERKFSEGASLKDLQHVPPEVHEEYGSGTHP